MNEIIFYPYIQTISISKFMFILSPVGESYFFVFALGWPMLTVPTQVGTTCRFSLIRVSVKCCKLSGLTLRAKYNRSRFYIPSAF